MKYNLHHLFSVNHISGICIDSRLIKPGDAFFVLCKDMQKIENICMQVISNGCKLLFTEVNINFNLNLSIDTNISTSITDVSIIVVNDIQQALKDALDILYPHIPSHMIAVTGTNGKSSIVSYCMQIFGLLGFQAASIGTLGVECTNKELSCKIQKDYNIELTTPDIVSFRKVLCDLNVNNVNYLAFEASSHALAQDRICGTQTQFVAFTNLTQDHLDYHITMENYLQAKLKIFSHILQKNGIAIVNSDMQQFDRIKAFMVQNGIKFYTIGLKGDLRILSTVQSIHGQTISFNYKHKNYLFDTSIIGAFQAYNLLMACALVEGFGYFGGFEMDDIVKIMPNLVSVKGRLQRITDINAKFHVFIDYAHTPDALKNTLQELQALKKKNSKLVVVFGCGGNRDKGKRSVMGIIASTIADQVIVTDDNPRFEDPEIIRSDILSQIKEKAIEISGREEAIKFAISQLEASDILVIAGKGHEEYQIVQNTKIPFSDAKIALSHIHRFI